MKFCKARLTFLITTYKAFRKLIRGRKPKNWKAYQTIMRYLSGNKYLKMCISGIFPCIKPWASNIRRPFPSFRANNGSSWSRDFSMHLRVFVSILEAKAPPAFTPKWAAGRMRWDSNTSRRTFSSKSCFFAGDKAFHSAPYLFLRLRRMTRLRISFPW